tara:strand:- start:47 stop:523 length:477 start_codon:yes stop_codon:yes gene_type:complete
MSRDRLIYEVSKYFDIRELVGEKTYSRHGNRSWKFLDPYLLSCILVVREGIGKPMTANTWHKGGRFSQRGLRTGVQQIVKSYFKRGQLYLSAHLFGRALDFTVQGMTATEVRQWCVDNSMLFPCKIRLEKTYKGKEISWVHLDTFWEEQNPQVYLFAA